MDAHRRSFQYPSSLKEGALRLLRPIAIDEENLSFEVIDISRKDADRYPYTAISYAWGGEEPIFSINLNEASFPVRPNLWSCLYHLGELCSKSTIKWHYIWVDAICINQADDSEKSSQVRLMGETYSQATRVSVWLGLPGSGVALQDPFSNDPPKLDLMMDNIKNYGNRLDWQAEMPDLANRSYWTRMWVVQEFLLARDVRIHCGSASIHWEQFWHSFCRSGLIEAQVPGQPLGTTTTPPAMAILLGRRLRDAAGKRPLWMLLAEHGESDCTDPRDHVFALLGLAIDGHTFSVEFPNYSLSYREVVRHTLDHLLDPSKRTPGLPAAFTIDHTKEIVLTLLLKRMGLAEAPEAMKIDAYCMAKGIWNKYYGMHVM